MAIGPDDVDGQAKRLIDSIASGEYTRKVTIMVDVFFVEL